MGARGGLGGVAAAAFVGAALAGLPPIRDGLDRLSERVARLRTRPRWPDIVRAVRWYHEDRKLAYGNGPMEPTVIGGIIRARRDGLRPRELAVYREVARREAQHAFAAQRGAGGRSRRTPLR